MICDGIFQYNTMELFQIRSMVTEFLETERQMTDALLLCKAAIDSGSVELVSDYQLKIEPDFIDARKTLEKEVLEEMKKDDAFNDNDTAKDIGRSFNSTSHVTTTTTNGFGHADPFADQSSLSKSGATTTKNHFTEDSFNMNDGFDTSFGTAFGSHTSTIGQTTMMDPFGRNPSATAADAVSPLPTADNVFAFEIIFYYTNHNNNNNTNHELFWWFR